MARAPRTGRRWKPPRTRAILADGQSSRATTARSSGHTTASRSTAGRRMPRPATGPATISTTSGTSRVDRRGPVRLPPPPDLPAGLAPAPGFAPPTDRMTMAATLPHPDLVAAIPRLRRYARVLTGEATRADDLVQDTLARAWEKRALWLAG